ncbi:MAG: c-type cytochrome, partial [Gemmatimonadota bacterium]
TADSSYTEEQAGRGEQVFTRVCLECHARTEMANADFRLKWGGQTTFDLYKSIVTTMPDSDPGSLPRADYEDVVAYILKLNGIPAGTAPLSGDSTAMSRKLVLPPKGDSTASVGARMLPVQRLVARRSARLALVVVLRP